MIKQWILAALFLMALGAPVAWAAGPININTATADELTQLVSIGPAKAAAIVSFRDEHGPFRSVQELTNVTGVGERIVEMNLDRIQLD